MYIHVPWIPTSSTKKIFAYKNWKWKQMLHTQEARPAGARNTYVQIQRKAALV